MKLSNFNDVTKLIKVRDKIETNIDIIEENYQRDDKDVGGIEGILETGYSMYLSLHSDGSGRIADLSGCYVGDEVVDAVLEVLKKKLLEIEMRLEDLGVELE